MTSRVPPHLFRAAAAIAAFVVLPPHLGCAADGHAADDELALSAAQLAGQADVRATFVTGGAAAAIDPADCINSGAWSSVIPWTPHIPVSAANLPDGRLLTFASNQRTTFPSGVEFTYAATWNPATGQFQEFNHGTHDMFCGGITLMPDGRVMVNGGRNETPFASVFDWRTNTWTRVQNMNGGRWYNTSVSLPNGNVFTATGSGTGTNTTERWSPSGWTVMTGVPWNTAVSADPGYIKIWHPFLSVAPDGRVLHFGPTDTMHWFSMAGTGSTVNAGAAIPGSHYPKEGCYAVYDEGKVLVAGGGRDTVAAAHDGSIGTSTEPDGISAPVCQCRGAAKRRGAGDRREQPRTEIQRRRLDHAMRDLEPAHRRMAHGGKHQRAAKLSQRGAAAPRWPRVVRGRRPRRRRPSRCADFHAAVPLQR